jgi:phosphinothricin acetyltransferase
VDRHGAALQAHSRGTAFYTRAMDQRTAIVIRPARPADVPRIVEIYRPQVLSGLATFETTPPDAGEMARRLADIVSRGMPYLVAEADGVVAGYAYANVYRTRPAYRYTVEDSVYLDDAYLRRGIGRCLLDALIDDCAARGFRQMVAVIGDSANDASIALHRACGFGWVGILSASGWKLGRWVDSVLMQRALGEGGATPPSA